MEDKIRRLSQEVIEAEDGSESLQAALVELRSAISKHVENLRHQISEYPVKKDRRGSRS